MRRVLLENEWCAVFEYAQSWCCSTPPAQSRSEDNSCAVFILGTRNVQLGWRSPAAWSHFSCERGELVQVQNVDAWRSCWILWLWSEQSATDCRSAPTFAAVLFCGFSMIQLRVRPNFPWFSYVRLSLACIYGSLRLFQNSSTTCEIVLLFFRK